MEAKLKKMTRGDVSLMLPPEQGEPDDGHCSSLPHRSARRPVRDDCAMAGASQTAGGIAKASTPPTPPTLSTKPLALDLGENIVAEPASLLIR